MKNGVWKPYEIRAEDSEKLFSLKGGMLEITLTSQTMSGEELAEILSRYDRKKKYYRLKSGDFVDMEEGSLRSLLEIKEGLGFSQKQMEQEQILVPEYRAIYLDSQLEEVCGLTVKKDRYFKALVRDMKTVDDNDFEVPASLLSVLRSYQIHGFLWLKTLEHNGFGGILADEMGLGKTLQVIAFLLSSYEEAKEGENRRCLIVSPASLVFNWASELERFAPALPVKIAAGTAKERKAVIEQAGEKDILITSYELLKRDIENYEKLEFFCQVADEAQYMKNAGTQTARAAKKIYAKFKIALTGTPVENRLSDLWSIFDYCMPGFLFSYEKFRKELELPIVQNENEKASKRLQKMIKPFVLRRLKKDVLKDLPDKIEKNVYARMQGEQKELYDAHVQRLKRMLDKQTDAQFRSSKIQILSELTKLRQICCCPGLIYEGYHGESSKEDMCIELIQHAVSGGHKVLLFSQFVTMLDKLQQGLEKAGISFYRLTGDVSKEKRSKMVKAFQENDICVFCISLKAGGTGLNLTAADIVIHYDPWWNLAVQNQAADRAHRIGQENPVNVYRLIEKGTIEEKIIWLQEQKRKLSEQILGQEDMGTGMFSREDLIELLSE